jgi:predicted RNA binding protein YcfA (HicA-like mRNA interferase family)
MSQRIAAKSQAVVEAARVLKRCGFVELRQSGSHLILRRAGRTVVVPQHKPLKPGTLKGIIEQAGLTLEELIAHL